MMMVEGLCRRFCFRPSKIWSIVSETLRDGDVMKRRPREGGAFSHGLRRRKEADAAG